ncbi:MAG: hypothetical protein HOP17_08665 [Acidobacteria bacterium]|nr:hypothetical protein [Acidobacteriota bacterium]
MKKKCLQCRLVNYPTANECVRCGSMLTIEFEKVASSFAQKLIGRAIFFLFVCFAAIAGFYASLVFSSKAMTYEQKRTIGESTDLLRSRGFTTEALILAHLATFRSTDNWLNASVVKENAFAAANFPLGIVTIYSDFFTYPADEVERAAILLHEAKHLQGADEKEAYEFVWRNRDKLGWTSEKYSESVVWNEIRKQTRDYVPGLFVCDVNPAGDCTESRVPSLNF